MFDLKQANIVYYTRNNDNGYDPKKITLCWERPWSRKCLLGNDRLPEPIVVSKWDVFRLATTITTKGKEKRVRKILEKLSAANEKSQIKNDVTGGEPVYQQEVYASLFTDEDKFRIKTPWRDTIATATLSAVNLGVSLFDTAIRANIIAVLINGFVFCLGAFDILPRLISGVKSPRYAKYVEPRSLLISAAGVQTEISKVVDKKGKGEAETK